MTTVSINPRDITVERAAPGVRTSKVVYVWAWIGAALVGVGAWSIGSWLLSGPEAITRFRDPGSAGWWWARIFEGGFFVISMLVAFFVIRQCVRQRRLTTDAMICLGIFSIWWQDPLYNYLRPGFLYNSNLVNLESWITHIPFQQAPYANLQPEPVLWGFSIYFSVMFVQVLLMCWIMRQVQRRWATVRGWQMFLLVSFLGFVMDAGLELPMLWTRTYNYPAGWHGLAIFGGRPYQLPLVHLAAGAMFFAAVAALRYYRDDKGRTVVERGADSITNQRRQTAVRLLAVVGFVQVVSLAYCPIVLSQIATTDPFPKGYETWQLNGLCGDEGQPYGPCPAPGVSWKVRASQSDRPHPSEIYREFPYFSTPAGRGK
jgi:hypothetical protein